MLDFKKPLWGRAIAREFCKANGFVAILERLNGKAAPNAPPFSLALFRNYLLILRRLVNFFNPSWEQLAELIGNFVTPCFQRIKSTTEEEIKTQWDDRSLNFQEQAQNAFVAFVQPLQDGEKLADCFRLEIANRLLRCQYLDKRLAGLNEMRSVCKRGMELGDRKAGGEQSWFCKDPRVFYQWVIENQIIEYLFGPTFHPELAKRSAEILMFVGYMHQHALPQQFVDLVWDSQVGKHESITHMVFSLCCDIIWYLGPETLTYLLSKVKAIPLADYSPPLVQLISSIGQAFSWLVEETGDAKSVVAPFFWELIVSGQLSLELVSKCKDGLFQLLERRETALSERVEAAEFCLAAIRSHSQHAVEAYRILLRVLDCSWRDENALGPNPTESDMRLSDAGRELHARIFVESKLLDLLWADLLHFASKYLETSVDVSVRAASLPFLKERLDSYAAFFRYGRLEITRNTLEQVWDKLIVTLPSDARDVALRWLLDNATQPSGQQLPPLVSLDDCSWLFETRMKNMDVSGLGEQGFKTFDHFLRVALAQAEKSSTEKPFKPTEFAGLETLWRICLDCDSATVSQLAVFTLVRLHAIPAVDGGDNSVPPPQALLHSAMKRLKSLAASITPESSKRVSRCVMLLQKILSDLNNVSNSSVVASSGQGRPCKIVAQVMQRGKFFIDILSGDSVWVLKQKIATQIQDAPAMLRLISIGKELRPDEAALDSIIPDIKDDFLIHVTRRMTVTSPVDPPASAETKRLSLSETGNTLSSILAELYFGDLFALLSLPSPLGQQIWDLLMKLPTNKGQLAQLRSLDSVADGSEPGWRGLFDLDSTFKLFYSLQIVDSLLHSAKPANVTTEAPDWSVDSWRAKFVERGGVRFLLHALLNVDLLDDSKGSKRISCVAIMVRLISDFCLEKPSLPAPADKPALPRLHDQALRSAGVEAASLAAKLLSIIHACASGGANFGSEDSAPVSTATDAPQNALPNPGELLAVATLSLLTAVCVSADSGEILARYPSIGKWLETTLLSGYSDRIRDSVRVSLMQIADFLTPESSSAFVASFLPLLLHFVEEVSDVSSSSPLAFFSVCAHFVRKAPASPAVLDPLAKLVVERIKSHTIVELRGVPFQDYFFQGILDLLTALIDVSPAHKTSTGQQAGLVEWIFEHGLFEIASPENNGPNCPPICKARETRVAAFRALYEYSKGADTFEILSTCMRKLLHTRERPLKVWAYAPGVVEKAASGIVGLKNLGATCYMNSLTQQFYMIPQFRAGLLRAQELKPENPDDPQDSLLVQMQAIMANLQESERRYYDTIPFCKVYKPQGNQPMNPGVQMDVDEFFLNLFDKLEKSTKGSPQEKILKDFFGGQFAQQIVSRECEHVSERDEDFFTLSVEVKGKRKLEESLDLFVKGDLLDGDNKYFCDKCNKRVDALKRCCLKSLPNNLFVHLKRFDFDFELLRRSKVNEYCEFPMLLNMEPYTREGLSRREHSEPPASAEDLANYEYELTGVIVHSGTVDSGHYYSYIKDRLSPDNKWYLFNDADVELWDPANLASQCFGGSDSSSYGAGRGSRSIPKHYSAYMLVYSKVVPTAPEVKKPLTRADLAQSVPRALYEQTWQDNNDFLMDKLLFDSDFFHFVSSVVQAQTVSASIAPYSPELRVGKPLEFDRLRAAAELGLRFFVEILVHAKDKEPKLSELHATLCRTLASSPQAAQWFLHHMCRTNLAWVHKILEDCPLVDVRAKFATLIEFSVTAMSSLERTVYGEILLEDIVDSSDVIADREREAERYDEVKRRLLDMRARFAQAARKTAEEKGKKYFDDDLPALSSDVKLNVAADTSRSIVIDFMDRMTLLLHDIHLFSRTFSEYFHIFELFAGLGQAERQFLLNRNVVVALLELYLGADSPNWVGPHRHSLNLGRNERQAVEGMKHALGTIWTVLRHCKTPLQMQNNSAPSSPFAGSQEGGLFDLPQPLCDFILKQQTLYRLVEDATYPEAVNALLCHWSFENADVSQQLVQHLVAELKSLDASALGPLLHTIGSLMTVSDSLSAQRTSMTVSTFVAAVLEGADDKNSTMVCLKFLVDLAEEMPAVRELLFASRSSWLNPLLFHASDAVRTITEQLLLTICLLANAYDTGYDKLVSTDHYLNSPGPEALKAQAAKRAALFSSPAADSEAHLAMLYADLLALLPEVKRFSHVGKKPASGPPTADFFGTRQWGRLMCFALRPEQRPSFVSQWPTLLDAMASLEGDNQVQSDQSKAQLMLLLDKLTEGCPEMCAAVASSLSHPQQRAQLENLINYAFWADANNAALSEFNEVNMTCYFRVMERLSMTSKDILHEVVTSRPWPWLVKWVIIHDTNYYRAAEAMISLAAYAASVDVNWRRGQMIQLVPLVSARVSAPIVHRQLKMFLAFLVDKEDYLQMCEHKGLNWILSSIGMHAGNAHTKPVPEAHTSLAFAILNRSLEEWAPAFLQPESVPESFRERAAAYRTSTMLPLINQSQVCLTVGLSLCFAVTEPTSDPDFVKLLLSIVKRLLIIEPVKCQDDITNALRRYFVEIAKKSAASSTEDKMEVDTPAAGHELFSRTANLCAGIISDFIKRQVSAAAPSSQPDEAATNPWLPIFDLSCQLLLKWLIPTGDVRAITSLVESMLLFFSEDPRSLLAFSELESALKLLKEIIFDRVPSSPTVLLFSRRLLKIFAVSDKSNSLKEIIDLTLAPVRETSTLSALVIDLVESLFELGDDLAARLLSEEHRALLRGAASPAADESLTARASAMMERL
jgi:ubiquitin C-terminal hydrolase